MTPKALKQALRAHRVVAGSGPYLSLTRNGRSIVGAQVDSPLEARLAIQAPCWISVDRLALVANGRVARRWTISGRRVEATCDGTCGLEASSPSPTRSRGTLDLGNPIPRAMEPGTCHTQKIEIPLRWQPKKDTWVVLVAWSTKGNPSLARPGGLVLSFTNPVWIDANGNGRFDPPSLPRYPLR